MQNNGKRGESTQEPAEGSDDIPPPERGSPGGNENPKHDEAVERVQKGKDTDPNPLAPPVNTQAGS